MSNSMYISTYKGSKRRLSDILALLFDETPHDIYVEPFGGLAAILLNKFPTKRTIYNDILFHNFFILNAFSNSNIYKYFMDTILNFEEYSLEGFCNLWDNYLDLLVDYVDRLEKISDELYFRYIKSSIIGYLSGFGNTKEDCSSKDDISIRKKIFIKLGLSSKKISSVQDNNNSIDANQLDLDLLRYNLNLKYQDYKFLGKLAGVSLLILEMSVHGDFSRISFKGNENLNIDKSFQERIIGDFDFIQSKLDGVECYCLDAIFLLKKLDLLSKDNVLIYCDPPYISTDAYSGHPNEDIGFKVNSELVNLISNTSNLACKIAISGYNDNCKILDNLLNIDDFKKTSIEVQMNSLKADFSEEIIWNNL